MANSQLKKTELETPFFKAKSFSKQIRYDSAYSEDESMVFSHVPTPKAGTSSVLVRPLLARVLSLIFIQSEKWTKQLGIVQKVYKYKISFVFSPTRYSPDLIPVEHLWSDTKSILTTES